ncbi:hypothetical protein EP7_001249 [Isosphaeraceae bacterium EP7]
MHVALALLAMSAAPLAANPQPPTLDKQVSFEIRVVEMKGLGWRADFQQQLKPVSTREGKSAWTIDQVVLKSLLEECNETTAAPRVTTFEGADATVKTGKPWKIVSSVREVVDAPKGVIKGAAYLPKVASVDSGDSVKASGRQLEQGMLVDVSWDVQQVLALHNVTHKGVEVEGQGKINAQYQVPEIVKDSYKGEWLVPEDSALVLSMGPRTVAGPLNLAQVRERVLVVTARHVLTPAEENEALTNQATFSTPPVTAPEPKAWMPTPTPPSRALPQAPAVDGSLPPLPDDTMHVTPESGDVDPKATPQMRAPEKKPGEEAPKAVKPAGEPEKPVADASHVPAPHRATARVEPPVSGGPVLFGENLADVGPDRQEPFQNRTYADIVIDVKEIAAGKLIPGVGSKSTDDLILQGIYLQSALNKAKQQCDPTTQRSVATGGSVSPACAASSSDFDKSLSVAADGFPLADYMREIAIGRAEPFPNGSHGDIVTKVDESPKGRAMFSTAASSFTDRHPELLHPSATVFDSQLLKSGLTEKMGAIMSAKLDFDAEALSRLQTETKVTRIPMAGNLALEITARVVPAPKVASDAAPECPLAK